MAKKSIWKSIVNGAINCFVNVAVFIIVTMISPFIVLLYGIIGLIKTYIRVFSDESSESIIDTINDDGAIEKEKQSC